MEMAWNQEVWNLVRQIPNGKVASYGQLAAMLGHPRRARQIGYALHATPTDFPIPWHRVINAKGAISFPMHSEQYLTQKTLLLAEGVVFSDADRINFKQFGWRP